MSKDCDNCGDNHDDYDPNEDPLVMSFALGSPNIRPEALQAIIQTCVSEMFIRIPKGEFEEQWAFINNMIIEMFDADRTPQPEALAVFTKARDALAKRRDEGKFIESVLGDLDGMDTFEDKDNYLDKVLDTLKEKLFDKNDDPDNVTDITKNVPKTNNDDYGNYL